MSDVRSAIGSLRDSTRPRPQRRRAPRAPVLVVALVLLIGSLAGCSARDGTAAAAGAAASVPAGAADRTTPPPTPPPTPSPTPPPAPAPSAEATRTFVAVGDSITAGSTPLVGDAVPSIGSWIPAADSAPLRFAGGWAVPGSTTADMLASVPPMEADVLVMMGGTNDLLRHLDRTAALENLTAVSRTVAAGEVLVVAVPPLDVDPTASVGFNQQLQGLAAEQGWGFVDPWEGVGVDGAYLPEATGDGIHPNAEAADLAGGRIRTALLYGG